MSAYLSRDTGLILKVTYTKEDLEKILITFQSTLEELESFDVHLGLCSYLSFNCELDNKKTIFDFFNNNRPSKNLHKDFYILGDYGDYFWEENNKKIRIDFCKYLITLLKKEIKMYNS